MAKRNNCISVCDEVSGTIILAYVYTRMCVPSTNDYPICTDRCQPCSAPH